MPSQYIYTHSTGSNVDLSARVRAYRTSMSANAEEGATAISTIIVDDEEAGIDIRGLRQFDWKESSEGSNSRIIFRGWTADRDISRGPFRVQRSRQWSVNISDLNSALNRRIMRGADANRPAETDVARIQWAVSTTELNILTDSTYISTASPTAMDANDYRNQRVFDIIDDCAQQSGKNYFLILNENFNPPRLGLFYDFAYSTAYASTVRLTNVVADVDSTTTYAILQEETKLNRDPSRVYPTVIVPYNGGDVYLNDPSISANFFPRDTMAPAVNVHSASVARTRGLRYLADISTEEDRITTGYIVPLARVNQLREGHTFQAKFSHLPGYTDWTWLRALKRTVTAISEEFYKVELECSPAAAGTASVASCATSLGSLATWNSGRIGSGGTPHATPWIWTPAPTGSGPIVTGGFASGGGGAWYTAPWTPAAAAYVTQGVYETSGTSPNGTYMGYSSSGAGTVHIDYDATPGFDGGYALAVRVPTSATAPVQMGQSSSVDTVTLGAAPTAGNLLIAFSGGITNGGISPAAGWTAIVGPIAFPIGLASSGVVMLARCVQPGETATVLVGSSPYPHWTFLQEWALT